MARTDSNSTPSESPARLPAADAGTEEKKDGKPDATEETKPVRRAPKRVNGVRPHEAWAADKGYMPAFATFKGGAPGLSNKRPNKKHWQYSAAMAGEAWKRGKEVTEAQFDAAIKKACGGATR